MMVPPMLQGASKMAVILTTLGTRKIGVSKVSVVCGVFVVLGLSDVDFGYVIDFRRLTQTR